MIEPVSGESFMLELPSLETATMQIFMSEFEKLEPESLHLILVDNASSHTTEKLKIGENIVFIFLPACSPELNPIERFWRELKDWLSDYEPQTMAEVGKLVAEGLKSFSAAAMSSITSFKYLMTAWLAVIA